MSKQGAAAVSYALWLGAAAAGQLHNAAQHAGRLWPRALAHRGGGGRGSATRLDGDFFLWNVLLAF